MNRICIPSTAVLSNGLSTVASTLTSAVQTSSFGNMITDVENVIIQINIELAMASMRLGNGCLHQSVVHVFVEMLSWLYCLGFLYWNHSRVRRSGIVLPL